MNEKMYDLKIPLGCTFHWAKGPDEEVTVHGITKAQAHALRLQCQEIEDEVEPTVPTAAEQPWTPRNGPVEYIHKPGVEAYYIGPWPPSTRGNEHVIWVAGEGYKCMVHLEELRPLPPEPEKREWRDWDVVQVILSRNVYARIGADMWRAIVTNIPAWTSGAINDCHADRHDYVYLFNLADILAQGEVPFFLKKDEIEILLSMRGKCGWESIVGKATDALVTYRKRRGVDQ